MARGCAGVRYLRRAIGHDERCAVRALLHGSVPAAEQVRARGGVHAAQRAYAARRLVPAANQRDCRELHQAVGRRAIVAAAYRGRDVLPRVRAHPAPDADTGAVPGVQRVVDGARLRRSAVADAGALGVGRRGAEPLRAPPPDGRSAAAGAARRDGAGEERQLRHRGVAAVVLLAPGLRLPLARVRRRHDEDAGRVVSRVRISVPGGHVFPGRLGASLRL